MYGDARGCCSCGDGVDLAVEFRERGRDVAPHEPSNKGNSIFAFVFDFACCAIFDFAFDLAALGGKARLLPSLVCVALELGCTRVGVFGEFFNDASDPDSTCVDAEALAVVAAASSFCSSLLPLLAVGEFSGSNVKSAVISSIMSLSLFRRSIISCTSCGIDADFDVFSKPVSF